MMYLIILLITITMSSVQQTISDEIGLDPSVKIREYYLNDKPMESYALREGFLLPSSSRIKYSPRTPTTADSSIVNQNGADIENDGFWKVDDEHLSKELMNIGVTIDGSGDGDTTEPPTSVTTTSMSIISTSLTTNLTTTPSQIVLSGYSTFFITLNCTNANAIFMNILNQFNMTFPYWYNVTYNNTGPTCSRSLNTDILFFTFFTSNNITVLTDLFLTLKSITSRLGIDLNSINPCGVSQTVSVTNFTYCSLIDLCHLCGTNPPRGVCLPEKNVSRCQCFIDDNNPTITYTDEFCTIPKANEVVSSLPSWVVIVIGILAGIIGLFCVIGIACLIIFMCRRHSQNSKYPLVNELQFEPHWFIPRVWIPTSYQRDDELIDDSYDPIGELDAILDNGYIDFTLPESSDRNTTLNSSSVL